MENKILGCTYRPSEGEAQSVKPKKLNKEGGKRNVTKETHRIATEFLGYKGQEKYTLTLRQNLVILKVNGHEFGKMSKTTGENWTLIKDGKTVALSQSGISQTVKEALRKIREASNGKGKEPENRYSSVSGEEVDIEAEREKSHSVTVHNHIPPCSCKGGSIDYAPLFQRQADLMDKQLDLLSEAVKELGRVGKGKRSEPVARAAVELTYVVQSCTQENKKVAEVATRIHTEISEALETTSTAKNDEIKALQNRLTVFEGTVKAYGRDNEGLKTLIETLEKEKTETEKKLQELGREKERLASENLNLKSGEKQAATYFKELEEKLRQVSAQHEKLQALSTTASFGRVGQSLSAATRALEFAKTNRELQEVKSQLKELAAKHERVLEESEILKRNLAVTDAFEEGLNSHPAEELARLEREKKALERRVAELEREIAASKESIEIRSALQELELIPELIASDTILGLPLTASLNKVETDDQMLLVDFADKTHQFASAIQKMTTDLSISGLKAELENSRDIAFGLVVENEEFKDTQKLLEDQLHQKEMMLEQLHKCLALKTRMESIRTVQNEKLSEKNTHLEKDLEIKNEDLKNAVADYARIQEEIDYIEEIYEEQQTAMNRTKGQIEVLINDILLPKMQKMEEENKIYLELMENNYRDEHRLLKKEASIAEQNEKSQRRLNMIQGHIK